ncbi:NmrA family NAD(P)-binding protein [Streptomyces sp. enrichment culture]|uniref:NmrA family NAD(P)-binding protein n=1 Tax=Streptomyces sp. enrichment culture TaxID=1795815 RepID=UPI003F5563C9
MILVTGASGALAGLVLDRLKAAEAAGGPEVIAGTRAPGPGARRVDFDDPASLGEGFAGVDVLVFVSAGYAEDDVVMARHGAVVEAAAAAGVRHVIYTSLAGSGERITLSVAHRWTEERLAEAPFATTVLRNGLYAEVPLWLALAASCASPADTGVLAAPFGDGRVSLVAREDLADVTAKVALQAHADGSHAGKVYELEGVESLHGDDIAGVLTEALGRPVRYEPTALSDVREPLAANGQLPYQIGHTVSIFANHRAGWLTADHSDLPALLDAPPRPVRPLVAAAVAGA